MPQVTIRKVEGKADLHCHYDGQTQQQDCFIELDCATGTLSARYNPEIGNAVPMDVWHGHTRRFGIPCLTAKAANDLMEGMLVDAQRVVDGYSSEWEGGNNAAKFTDDARQAIEDIEEEMRDIFWQDSDGLSEWDAADWFSDNGPEVSADADIAALVRQYEAEALADNVVLLDTERYLERLRDQATAKA